MKEFFANRFEGKAMIVTGAARGIGEAVALGSHVLMRAPHGRRAPECFENPAYSQELGCGDRASPAFYDTVRRIHARLAAASGEDE